MADNGNDKYKDFAIVSADYKIVKGHAIRADVLIPKSIVTKSAKQPRPIIVRFHGGFFITWGCLAPFLFPNWVLQYALQQEAIIVTANYRLIPESRGIDILEDADSLIAWLSTSLNPLLESRADLQGIVADPSHVLVVGESAGGYLSTQTGLRHGDKVKAIISQYPVLDLESKFFATSYEKTILGAPMQPASKIDEYLAKMAKDPVPRSEDVPPSMTEFMFAVVQQGHFPQLMGPEDEVYPFRVLAKGGKVRPHYLVIHGSDDSAVPAEHSERWIREVQQKQGKEHVRLIVRPGEHGFDGTATVDDEWFKPELEAVTKAWIG